LPDEDPARRTCTIEEAALLLGIGRTLAYALAKRDEFPVPLIRLGRRILVPKRALLRLLGEEDDSQ